jgi:glycosyltransferase involved in cell wall biosynthesis
MKVGINAQKLLSKDTGVGIYTTRLIENLITEEQDIDFVLFSSYGIDLPREYLRDGVELYLSPFPLNSNTLRILWEQSVLPFHVRKCGCDIFHYPDHTASLLMGVTPTIITVHDLAFLRFPQTFDLSRAMYKKMVINRSVGIADRIIAVSSFTKNELVDLLNIDPDKISIVYNGVSPMFREIDRGEARDRISYLIPGLKKDYLLFVGTLEPRKNVVSLVHSYNLLRKQGKIDAQLVIVGSRGWLYDKLFKEIAKNSLVDDIIFTGYVTNEQLVMLYNGANFLIYPALYEGFGLPVLEAMACGIPVITSDRSSLSEVAGDAAMKIDPNSEEDIADAMAKLYQNKELREEYRKRGLERAKMFSWQETARKTLKVYKDVYREREGG